MESKSIISAEVEVDIDKGVKAGATVVKKRGRKPKQYAEKLDNTKIKIYHFNMLPETIEAVDYFATLHKHDDIKTFKEAWEKWIQEDDIAELISIEIGRLKREGYCGDVLQKIFHSARYYYSKKPLAVAESGAGTEETPKKRKKYESIGKDVLDKMDRHIFKLIKENVVDVKCIDEKTVLYSDISPGDAFKAFIKDEIEVEGVVAGEMGKELMAKYKKTYKNRFFVIRCRGLRPPTTPHTAPILL